MKKNFLLFLSCFAILSAGAQLHIQSGTTVFIQTGAKIVVQGDVTSFSDIQGPGTLTMKGSALQNLNMNGLTVPNLEIDNTNNVLLITGATKIGTNLLFTAGKIRTGSQDLIITAPATITGNGASNFVWTDGTGQLKKELTGNVSNYVLPVGENANYRPAFLTTAGAAYAAANVGVRVVAGADPNRPPMIASFLNTYWPVTRTGITGGTVTIAGQYIDPADVSGTEANLAGYYFNGTDWSSSGETHNTATNQVSALMSGATGEISGLNRFALVGSRAFLQGAYSTTTGFNSDALRFTVALPTNLIPVGDPYRTAPYNTYFTHVNNPTAEVAPASVFLTVAPDANNIADWVYLELRNLTPGVGNVIQTRSALVQKDGDIVDIDGTSPVTFNFNNASPPLGGLSYAVSVRHRNHLGLSIDPSTSARAITETKSTAFTTNVIDLRTATDAQLWGTSGAAYTTATHPGLGTINLLWGGNINGNGFARYQGSNGGGPLGLNDRAALLQDLGSESTIYTTYHRGDVNFNRFTRYQGSNGGGPGGLNDRAWLLQQVLNSVESAIRTQALPN